MDSLTGRDGLDAPMEGLSAAYARSRTQLTWSSLRRAETSGANTSLMPKGRAALGALDMLRTRVAATMGEKKWTSLAITSPTSRCGSTTLALSLASGLARQRGARVVLFDFNLRSPSIAPALGLGGQFAIADFLNGLVDPQDCVVRRGEKLAIVPNNRSVADPTELLHSSVAAEAVQRVRDELSPNIVIFDLPPMLEHDDLLGFLPFVDCVLLVLGAERTSFGEADACERELSGREKLLGVVLNKCRLGLGEFDI